MKEIVLNNTFAIEGIDYVKQDRFELVLAENERILNRVNERLEIIDLRQEKIEVLYKELEGLIIFSEWKEKGMK
ncbi:hypothetical protein LYSIN_01571 [Lysinibacillus sphaericus]|uniref:Uncharacterized protein n=1 Tax=Lysinibacillus sphaericus TaxID=1421 RepID=A0A2S5D1C3_LYSSH|nr:hypothetical protein [Lysinibacillus sphaericus]POZ56788.1 hypothetical protein LYSIN_01571 [Lysinibacillus sphaericus]